MVKVPETGKAEKSFTRIIQQTNEPYMQFIDLLRDALDKQIDNVDVKEALLFKLAVENANVDCNRQQKIHLDLPFQYPRRTVRNLCKDIIGLYCHKE